MKLLREHTQFQHLLEQAEQYEALLNVVREALPEAFRQHIMGATLRSPALIIQIEHPHLATQLRLSEQALLQAVLTHWPHLKLNQVKVRLLQLPKPQRSVMHQPSAPGKATLQQLKSLEKEVTQEKLKQSLQRLIHTLEKRSS